MFSRDERDLGGRSRAKPKGKMKMMKGNVFASAFAFASSSSLCIIMPSICHHMKCKYGSMPVCCTFLFCLGREDETKEVVTPGVPSVDPNSVWPVEPKCITQGWESRGQTSRALNDPRNRERNTPLRSELTLSTTFYWRSGDSTKQSGPDNHQ